MVGKNFAEREIIPVYLVNAALLNAFGTNLGSS